MYYVNRAFGGGRQVYGEDKFHERGVVCTPPSSLFLLQIFCQFGWQVECIVFVNVYDYRIQADFFPASLSDRHDVAERRDVDLLPFVFTTSEGEPFSSLAGTISHLKSLNTSV